MRQVTREAGSRRMMNSRLLVFGVPQPLGDVRTGATPPKAHGLTRGGWGTQTPQVYSRGPATLRRGISNIHPHVKHTTHQHVPEVAEGYHLTGGGGDAYF